MDHFSQRLKARIPELFLDKLLADNVFVSIPVSLDGRTTQIRDVGVDIDDHFMYVNGHVLCTTGDRLRWCGITVENGTSKYDFVADLTISNGTLRVDHFQLNTFVLGVKVLSATDAADYLHEYMKEDNDWHTGYTISNGNNEQDFLKQVSPVEQVADSR